MRILGGMDEGEGKNNPVIAYEERYEATHPIDTSYEGTLARITGQTKEDIAFLLEFTRYSDQIAKYDPSSRYSFSEEEVTPSTYQFGEPSTSIIADIITPIKTNIFIDKRNYAV
jgi:hypothetical protein